MTPPEMVILQRVSNDVLYLRDLAEQSAQNTDHLLNVVIPDIKKDIETIKRELSEHMRVS